VLFLKKYLKGKSPFGDITHCWWPLVLHLAAIKAEPRIITRNTRLERRPLTRVHINAARPRVGCGEGGGGEGGGEGARRAEGVAGGEGVPGGEADGTDPCDRGGRYVNTVCIRCVCVCVCGLYQIVG